MSTFGVIPCPRNDGTCSVPNAPGGRVLIAEQGELIAVPRAQFDSMVRGKNPTEIRWQEVAVRAAATASAGGDDDGSSVSFVYPIEDSTRTVSGVFVKCQPCGHTWMDET
jgi:hypothetical protein